MPHRQLLQLAWDDLVRSHRFIEKANELDQLLEDAKGRKERGEPPKNLYQCVQLGSPSTQSR